MSNQAVVAPVLSRLDDVRRRIKNLYALHGAAVLALYAAAFVGVTFFLDWSLHLPKAVRFIFLFAGAGFLGYTALRRLVRPLAFSISDDDLALIVERKNPALADRLISAIQLARSPGAYEHFNSPELVDRLVADAADAVGDIDFRDVLVGRFVMRMAFFAGVSALVLASFGAVRPDLAAIYFNRLFGGDAAWPKRTFLLVEGFSTACPECNVVLTTDRRERECPACRAPLSDADWKPTLTVPRGDPQTIKVRVEGVVPDKAHLHFEFTETGEKGRETMRLVGNRDEGYSFTFDFARVNGPFTFHVEGGDDETPDHVILTDTPPTVLGLQAFYTYPAYTRLQTTSSEAPEPGGNVEAPLHTRVRIRGLANEDLAAVTVEYATDVKSEAVPAVLGPGPREFSFSFEVADDRARYEIRLRARNGLDNRDTLAYDVKGLRDQKPEIKVDSPRGLEEFVTPICKYPVRVSFSDDYGFARDANGLAELRLEYHLGGEDEETWHAVALKFPDADDVRETSLRGGEQADVRYTLDLARHALKPGDWIVFRFLAKDNKDIGGANEAKTKTYRLTITSVEELEKELERAVDKIKQNLVKQRVAAERNRARARRHQEEYTAESLAVADRGEVLMSQRNQLGISRALLGERDAIRYVRDRGEYNGIFNEEAVGKLDLAAAEIDRLATDDPNRVAISRLAAEALNRAADASARENRDAALEKAVELIDDVIGGIANALNLLERWATYQEIVRSFRQILEQQKLLKAWLAEKIGGGDGD